MNIKPDLDLNDGTYQILVSVSGKDVHLHDANDEAEMYLSADHFNKIAGLMGFIPISKLEELIEKWYRREVKSEYLLVKDIKKLIDERKGIKDE